MSHERGRVDSGKEQGGVGVGGQTTSEAELIHTSTFGWLALPSAEAESRQSARLSSEILNGKLVEVAV